MLIYGVQASRILRSAVVAFVFADGAAQFTKVLSTERLFYATILAVPAFLLWLQFDVWIQKKRQKDL